MRLAIGGWLWMASALAACDGPGAQRGGLAGGGGGGEEQAPCDAPCETPEPTPPAPGGELPGDTPLGPPFVAADARVSLAEGLPGRPMHPRVTVDGAGEALALWLQQRDEAPAFRLYARRHAARGWGAPEPLGEWQERMPAEIALARNSGGVAVAAWSGDGGVYASRDAEGGRWSEPELIGAVVEHGYVFGTRVSVDEDGDALVVWGVSSWDGTTSQTALWARAERGLGGWLDAELLTAGLASTQPEGFDAALAGGQLLGVWIERAESGEAADSGLMVWARRGQQLKDSMATAGWQPPEPLADPPQYVSRVWARLDAEGTALVGWSAIASATAGAGVWAMEARPGAPFGEASLVQADTTSSFGYPDSGPELATAPSGARLLMWRHVEQPEEWDDPPPTSLRARAFRPGAGWGPSEIVADGLAPPYHGCAMPPDEGFTVVLDDGGRALVVWHERVNDGTAVSELWLRVRSADGAWGEVVELGQGATWAREASAALAADAGYVVWTEEGMDEPSGTWRASLVATRLNVTPAP